MRIYGPRKENIAGGWRKYVIMGSGACIVMLLA
jgi:hypothetical protein